MPARKIKKPAAIKNGGPHPLGVNYRTDMTFGRKKKAVKKYRKITNG